ncbi:hypothetical protein PoB_001242800 [Plakobranchus ocellatus]|uniref:Uncharacterized protein n=1 Tax=Plakobranchus ocellatus TaxID=259542 RepID=A0AAV3YTP5_9GAST|nr:hypothetical protein PoB_001242800 [Plakobranchus ocellatus]
MYRACVCLHNERVSTVRQRTQEASECEKPGVSQHECVAWFGFLYIASAQQGDLRLSGPPSGQGAGGGTRTCNRRVTADLSADSLATVLPTPLHECVKSRESQTPDRKTLAGLRIPLIRHSRATWIGCSTSDGKRKPSEERRRILVLLLLHKDTQRHSRVPPLVPTLQGSHWTAFHIRPPLHLPKVTTNSMASPIYSPS